MKQAEVKLEPSRSPVKLFHNRECTGVLSTTKVHLPQTADKHPVKKYSRSFAVGRTPKIYPDISPIPPHFYRASKRSNFLSQFSTPVAFDALRLQNGGTYRKSHSSTLSNDDGALYRVPTHIFQPPLPQFLFFFYTGVKYFETRFYFSF